jgi:trigger factor
VIVTKVSESPTEVTLNISMDLEDEEPFIGRSYRRVVSRLQIPGFRRGKAPRSIVESHVGRIGLLQEALEFMIPETLDTVLKDEELRAYAEPELELLEMEPVSFKAIVPLEPVVDLGEFRSLRVERDEVEITEEEVDEVVEQVRVQSAPWEPVERPVQFGDLLNLDVTGEIDGEEAINDLGIDFIPEQDGQFPMPGFSIYLEGMSEGQEKDFTLNVPEEHHQEEYAGKACHYHVKVVSIKAKDLPDLDDEFAKGVGEGYESLEALREDLRGRISSDAEANAERQHHEMILQELLSSATIQASELIYRRELEGMQEDRERSLRNQRLDMETYLRYIGLTDEQWLEQMRPRAEERLKTHLVLGKVAEVEEIEVSTEEVQSEIDQMLSTAGESEAAMRQTLSAEPMRDNIRASLRNREVMRRLVEIMGGDAEESESPAAEDSGMAEPPEASAAEASTEDEGTEGPPQGAETNAE